MKLIDKIRELERLEFANCTRATKEVSVYIAYLDSTGYDTTCYEDDLNIDIITRTVSEYDLNKEVLDTVRRIYQMGCSTDKLVHYTIFIKANI